MKTVWHIRDSRGCDYLARNEDDFHALVNRLNAEHDGAQIEIFAQLVARDPAPSPAASAAEINR